MNNRSPSPVDRNHGFEFLRGTSYSYHRVPRRQRTHSHSGYYRRDNINSINFKDYIPQGGFQGKSSRHFVRTFKSSRPVMHNLPPRMQSIESGHSPAVPTLGEPPTDYARGDVKSCAPIDKDSADAFVSENFEKGDFRARSQSPDDEHLAQDAGSEFSKSRPESPDYNQLNENASQIQFLSAPDANLNANLQDRIKLTLTKLKDLNCKADVVMENTCMFAEAEKICSRIDSDRKYYKARFLESPKPLSPADSPPLILKDYGGDEIQISCSSSCSWNPNEPCSVFLTSPSGMQNAPLYNPSTSNINFSPGRTLCMTGYASDDYVPQASNDQFQQMTYALTNFHDAFSISPPCSSGSCYYPPSQQYSHAPSPGSLLPFDIQQKSPACFNRQQQQLCPPIYRPENNYSGVADFSAFPLENDGMSNKKGSGTSDRSSNKSLSIEPMDPAPSASTTNMFNCENEHNVETNKSVSVTTSAVCIYDKYKEIAVDSRFVDAYCQLDKIFDKFYDLKSQPPPNPHFPKPLGHKFKFDTYTLRERYATTWFPQYLSCVASFSVSSTDFDEEGNLFEKIIYNDDVWGTIGCHPIDAENYEMDTEAIITAKSLHPKILALGTMGLDFSPGSCGDKDLQKTVLERQLFIATRESAKPIVFHCCEAEDDGFKILSRVLPHDYPIFWYNFDEKIDVAKKWLANFTNVYFGVSMNIMDKKTIPVNNFYKEIPLNRLLVGSGAPNFLPKEYKESVPGVDCNHPGLGVLAAFKLAEIRKIEYKELLDQLLENIQRFYAMPLKLI